MGFFAFAAPLFFLLLLFKHVTADHAFVCSAESFSFPELPGAEKASITASLLQGFKGYTGLKPESAFIGSTGVVACNVTVSYTHPGDDDLVSVQVWLPVQNYNGRFVGVGGGGWKAGDAGVFGYDIMSALISQGYAVATTDAGYQHDVFSTADSWLFRDGQLNHPLITNFGHRSLHDLSVIGKHTIKMAFGSGPQFSYWHGCSTGGRQGLTLASRYPEDFDGILAGCPAGNWPALMLAMYWPQFIMNQLGTYPPAREFEAITAATVEACDKLDGVTDGIVSREDLCDFDPESVIGDEINVQGTKSTISKEAVAVYKAMRQGPVDIEGNQLFSGISLGTAVVGLMSLANTACEGSNCTRGQPFTIADDWIRLVLKNDPSYDPSKMSHSEYTQMFRESMQKWDAVFSSRSRDLRRFNGKGNKMIVWHSANDEAVPVKATRQYYENIRAFDKLHNTTTEDYLRYFEIPGATHCGAPSGAPYPLNALETLRSWVEQGVVPSQLPAILTGDASEKHIPQSICPYPRLTTSQHGGFVCKLLMDGVRNSREHIRDEL